MLKHKSVLNVRILSLQVGHILVIGQKLCVIVKAARETLVSAAAAAAVPPHLAATLFTYLA